MAKIDLDLINQQGYGRTVPKEMDLHIAKYVIGRRANDVSGNPQLFITERWDHSDVFYTSRTYLSQNGWDVTVYNDNVEGGSDRRKEFYENIKSICEEYYHVKRHEIGIYPKDRAVMTFLGSQYTVCFDSLRNLMGSGTDVVFVEKQGTVIKMSPFAEKTGLAFIDSEGFGSEYGIALARLCDKQAEAAQYTKDSEGKVWVPIHRGHLASLTDCDISGIAIAIKVCKAVRIGIDLRTIHEINNVNPGLDLKIEDLQEGIKLHKNNTHWKALQAILQFKGKLCEGLSYQQIRDHQNYLTETFEVDGEEIQFIDWLEHNRIELNTLISAAKPTAVWNWLKWKLQQVWPERNYNRAIFLNNNLRTPTMEKFIEWYDKLSDSLTTEKIKEKQEELCKVEGIIEDVESEQENIEDDIINNTLLPNEQVQKVDLALEGIMSNDGKAN